MVLAGATTADLAALDRQLADARPQAIIAAAIDAVPRGRLAVVSSFGAESAALLKYVADVDVSLPVIFLDTGWLFEETLGYRDLLVKKFGLTDVRSIKPETADIAREDAEGDLWFSNPDACCNLRKVMPLERALKDFDGWISGRKRYQSATRSDLAVVEREDGRLKFNPMANVGIEELQKFYAEENLPPHPLVASGFLSIGCMPCTSRVAPGEDPRAGRWRGRGKTECGIHVTPQN